MRRFSATPKLGWGVAKIDKLNRTMSHDLIKKIKDLSRRSGEWATSPPCTYDFLLDLCRGGLFATLPEKYDTARIYW